MLGSSGFIGRNLVAHLRQQGHEVLTPVRDTNLAGLELGSLIYAIGLTGDFRQRPLDAVDAHVGMLGRVLREAHFDSFLYLSSTRVYGGIPADQLAHEELTLPQSPTSDGLYDLSKLLGEAMCLVQDNPAVRVVRLSNVYGQGQSPYTFLQMLIDSLVRDGRVTIGEAVDSAKDYVALSDVVEILPQIALRGRARLYNLASGHSVSHGELVMRLRELTGGHIVFAANAFSRRFPRIDVSRLGQEFEWQPRALLTDLPTLLNTAE